MFEIKNDKIMAKIDKHGAELKSVQKNGREYMFCGDKKYWGRTSPVLFPFVGGLNKKKYSIDAKDYSMCQHGFARDCDFELYEKADDHIAFILKSNEETLKKYPFKFTLIISYILNDDTIIVKWKVINDNETNMFFSIGAHPAFNLKNGKNYFKFDCENDIIFRQLDENGLLVADKEYTLKNDGFVEIKNEMFDNDALVIEGKQAKRISMCDENRIPYITVTSDAPLFGLWSPAKKNAPFVCIEPWWGRCDKNDFVGSLSEREYTNELTAGEVFTVSYAITMA